MRVFLPRAGRWRCERASALRMVPAFADGDEVDARRRQARREPGGLSGRAASYDDLVTEHPDPTAKLDGKAALEPGSIAQADVDLLNG